MNKMQATTAIDWSDLATLPFLPEETENIWTVIQNKYFLS